MPVDEKLNMLRDEIRMEKTEQAVIYDQEGVEVLRKKGVHLSEEDAAKIKGILKGTTDYVSFSKGEWQLIDEKGYGLIHNHPFTHQGIFSAGDIKALIKHKLHVIETVTMDGTFIIRKTPGKQINPNLRRRILQAYVHYAELYASIVQKNADDINTWANEKSIPEGRAHAYLMALHRIIIIGAVRRAIEASGGTLELEYIPLNDMMKNKIDGDLRVLKQLDRDIENIPMGATMHAEVFTKNFLMTKKVTDMQYSPKTEFTERHEL